MLSGKDTFNFSNEQPYVSPLSGEIFEKPYSTQRPDTMWFFGVEIKLARTSSTPHNALTARRLSQNNA